MHHRPALLLGFCFIVFSAHAQEIVDGKFPVTSNLKAGVAKVDISPPDAAAIQIVGHVRRVTGVRDPLRAGVLILDDVLATGGTIIAASQLLQKAGFQVAGALTFLEIAGLNGGELLAQKGITNKTVLIA